MKGYVQTVYQPEPHIRLSVCPYPAGGIVMFSGGGAGGLDFRIDLMPCHLPAVRELVAKLSELAAKQDAEAAA